LLHRKYLQAYWQEVINEHEKENLIPTHSRRMVVNDSTKNLSEFFQNEKQSNLSFCYNILNELVNKSYATPFYKCSTKELKHPMDLFTINLKLVSNKYMSAEEFEKDVRLMFYNCFTYNDVGEIYYLGKALESVFNNKWIKRPISQTKQKET
jgi:hypothetical protein